jgi:hypothetical protein
MDHAARALENKILSHLFLPKWIFIQSNVAGLNVIHFSTEMDIYPIQSRKIKFHPCLSAEMDIYPIQSRRPKA